MVPPGADGPYQIDTAVLDPPGQSIGWYATLGAELLKPHITNRLTTPGPLAPALSGPIRLPVAPLDWTGAPQLGLGYRFDNGAGELLVDYRLVASAGSELLPGLDSTGAGLLRSRLNLNTVDVDYVLPEFLTPEGVDTSWWFRRELRAGFGLRVASAFFDSAAGRQALDERVSSLFAGVGPHAFWDYRQKLGDGPLWLYTRLDAAGVFGKIRQRFSEVAVGPGGAVAAGGFDTGRLSSGVGVGGFEAGLSWANPFGYRALRLTAAYSWERWWNLGRTDDSNAELTLQGLVFRAEFRY
jgi:hypothetical protein